MNLLNNEKNNNVCEEKKKLNNLKYIYNEYIKIKNSKSKIDFTQKVLPIFVKIDNEYRCHMFKYYDQSETDEQMMIEFTIIKKFFKLYNYSIKKNADNDFIIFTFKNIYNFITNHITKKIIDHASLEILNEYLIKNIDQLNYSNIGDEYKKVNIYTFQIYLYYFNNFIFFEILDSIKIIDKYIRDLLESFINKFSIMELINLLNNFNTITNIHDTKYFNFMLLILYFIFNYMNNENYFIKLLDKDDIRFEFKKIFNNIKDEIINSGNEENKEIVEKIKKSIKLGEERNEKLNKFNEPYHDSFNEAMQIKTFREYENKLKIRTEISKNSNSSSRVYKGTYIDNGQEKKCYCKIFKLSKDEPNKNLLYEQKVYRYLKNRNTELKDYYEKYFVKVYDVFKMKKTEIKKLIYLNYKTKKKKSCYSSFYDFFNQEYYYIMITEDMEGIPYQTFFTKHIYTFQYFINTIFDMIYGIYIMNEKLKLYHYDNHFNNVIIKIFDPPETVTNYYQINKIEFSRKVPYRISFYDFDFSYLENENNLSNDAESIPQNKISISDIWFVSRRILYIKEHNDLVYDFVKSIIFNNKLSYRFNYDDNVDNDFDIRDHYIIQDLKPGSDHTELKAINVLLRFLLNPFYYEELNITEINSFYNKYIKYKKKYLKLKII